MTLNPNTDRPDISMTDDEVDAFLARCPQMVVGAIDADGWPTGTIAASTYVDGALSLRFADDDPVLEIISRERAADGAICCVADEHATYFEIRGVIVHGHAHGRPDAPARATVEVDRIISFDFGRLQRR